MSQSDSQQAGSSPGEATMGCSGERGRESCDWVHLKTKLRRALHDCPQPPIHSPMAPMRRVKFARVRGLPGLPPYREFAGLGDSVSRFTRIDFSRQKLQRSPASYLKGGDSDANVFQGHRRPGLSSRPSSFFTHVRTSCGGVLDILLVQRVAPKITCMADSDDASGTGCRRRRAAPGREVPSSIGLMLVASAWSLAAAAQPHEGLPGTR